MNKTMKRRMFLRGVGGATLAAPFLHSLGVRPLRAQEVPTDPRRMVIFYTNNGCLTNRWFPNLGSADGAITPESLSGTLAPLADKADKLLFPRGLRMAMNSFSISVDGKDYFDPHDQGMGSKLTCAPIDPEGSHYALGRSFDHEVAELFNQGPNKSPLVLSVGFGGGTDVKQVLSYSASRTPYPAETNAQNVYSSLTGLFVGGETEADYRVARGQSIIDLVSDDLNTFKRLNMSAADHKKVDDWLDLLRSTETRVIPAACNQASAEGIGLVEGSIPGGQFGNGVTHENAEVMFRLIALTMMCDNNRSIVMQWPGYSVFEFLGHTIDHHGLSHRVGSAAVSGTCVSGVLDRIREIDEWFAGRYAELVTLLDSIEEGSGTMLDNSICMWLPELADGNAHNNNNLPIVIAGSCGGYFKQGVSVNVDGGNLGAGTNQTGESESACASGDTTEEVNSGSGTGSNGGQVPLNKLYATILNALGAGNPDWVPVDSWGVSDAGGGGFSGIDFTTDGNGTVTGGPGITSPGELTALKA